MRPFEFLLFLEVCLAILWLVANRRIRRKSILAVVLLIPFGLHYYLEGIRWQMFFVYGISIVLIVVNVNRWKNTIFRKVILIMTLLFILVSGTVSILVPVFEFPELVSKYRVGTYNLTLKDTKGKHRDILVKFWFPASQETIERSKYLQNRERSLDGLMGMPNFVFGHLSLVETAAYYTMEVIEGAAKFPLVIYSHGAASTNLDNTALLQEIAGNGYVVMAIDHNFSFERYGLDKSNATTLTFKAQKKFIQDLVQKVVPNQVDDILVSLQNIKNNDFFLANHINFDQVVLMGHSLGGTTATVAGLEDKNIKSVINVDGPISLTSIETFDVPLLYISSFSPTLPDEELEEKNLPNVKLYQKIKKLELDGVKKIMEENFEKSHWVRFKNAGHMDFTDLPYIVPTMATKGYDKKEGHALKSKVIIDFLNFSVKESHNFIKEKNHSLEWIQ
ncbi:hypothetical protein LV716_08490 [Flagellimonas sp. HMM57]|uniref:alpha/beta hydrolase family protein n=1 Tax=unclassified Flagellimonas TaxID=2644544 RepID=UPI0013D769B5|nr:MULTISPECIES: hypothetical protein [unclassified Flagellimonas]UII77793.1 hypothetical protein LV716_08490 [Flagellimonas sp. HMM57]